MKRKVSFILVLSSLGILLTGCSVKDTAKKGKNFLKRIVNKGFSILDKFFENDKPSRTSSGVEYTLLLRK